MTGLEPLVVQIDQGSSVLRLVVSGELDIATVPDLEAAFDQALASDPQSIEVDLSQVTFIDSTGIRLLLLISERGDGRVGLIPGAQVGRVIEITGMRSRLPLVDR